jgi:hypothetical protein
LIFGNARGLDCVQNFVQSKIILCLALVLSGFSPGMAQNSIQLRIPGADPSIRHAFRVEVPTAVLVKRIKGVLAIQGDPSSLEFTNLMVGSKMTMGMWCDVYVYAAGESRPTNYCHGVEGALEPDIWTGNGANFNTQGYYWRPDGNGIAVQSDLEIPWCRTHEGGVVPGKKYAVEMDLTIFETDYLESSPHWNPQSSKYYKILWQRTLKKTVE